MWTPASLRNAICPDISTSLRVGPLFVLTIVRERTHARTRTHIYIHAYTHDRKERKGAVSSTFNLFERPGRLLLRSCFSVRGEISR